LAILLRENGVDADVDLFHSHEPTDWSRFGPKAIRACRWVIVAVSEAWQRAYNRENEPTTNAGAAGEANALRGLFAEDQSDFERRVILVLLPGRKPSDIPQELRATTPSVRVKELTPLGLEELLRILHARPAYSKPEIGAVPVLAPRAPGAASAGGQPSASEPGEDQARPPEHPRSRVTPPDLQPLESPTGTFNLHMPAGPLNAHLTNRGGSTAEILEAKLITFIGDFDGEMWVEEQAPLVPERGPSAKLMRYGKLTVCFGENTLAPILQNPEPLRLIIRFRAVGSPELYEYSLKLHRAAAQPSARPQWRSKDPELVVIG
jgi:hypothetical protein